MFFGNFSTLKAADRDSKKRKISSTVWHILNVILHCIRYTYYKFVNNKTNDVDADD